MEKKNFVTRWLEDANTVVFNSYCIAAAFCTYFCMYAFRKPFSTAQYIGEGNAPLKAGISFLPEDLTYKSLLIISQLLGYTLSKYIGIKVISEMGKKRRAMAIVAMIVFAELALLGFATVPMPYNVFFLFLNGIPLGMIWGLVFGFLEGRRSTELLGAGLSSSYIIASGAVKSVGQWLLNLGVPEFWMPFATGALFFPFLLIFVYMLKLIPAPSPEDEAMRTIRLPMQAQQRKKFFWTFAPGLACLLGLYMFLTAYRDFRDNFAREIWGVLGYADNEKVKMFTAAEVPVAFGVMVALAALMLIKNNRKGLLATHLVMFGGAVLIGVSTLFYELCLISGGAWMVLVGLGLYLGYVPYGCILFDRLIAYVGVIATAGFMIYVADALGYTASAGVLLYKDLFYQKGFGQERIFTFFKYFSYATSIICSIAFILSYVYFSRMDVAEKQKKLQ